MTDIENIKRLLTSCTAAQRGELFAHLRKEIAIGSKQADRGEFVDGEGTFAEIRRRSAERKRAKR